MVSELPLPLRGLALLLGERDGDLLGFPSLPYRIPLCGTMGTNDLFRIHLVPHALHSTAASGGPRLHCGDSYGFMQCGFMHGPTGFSPRFLGDALPLLRGLVTFFLGDREAADAEGSLVSVYWSANGEMCCIMAVALIGRETPRENPSSMVDTPALSEGPPVPGSWSLSKISHAIKSKASPSIPLFSPPLGTMPVVRLPHSPLRLLDGDVLRDRGISDGGSRKSSGSYGCLTVRTLVEVLREDVSTVAPVSCESSDERDVVLPSVCSVI